MTSVDSPSHVALHSEAPASTPAGDASPSTSPTAPANPLPATSTHDSSFLAMTRTSEEDSKAQEDTFVALEEETYVQQEKDTLEKGDEEASSSQEDPHSALRSETVVARQPDLDEPTSSHSENISEIREKAIDLKEEVWHPLRPSEATEAKEGHADQTVQDITVVVEEGDVVDSQGRVLFPEDADEKATPYSERRTSQLRLNLDLTGVGNESPPPWERVDPPVANGHNKTDPYHSQGFDVLQEHKRPLIPTSSYYFGPPPSDSAFGSPPVGQIGLHHPREILRVERDYTGGELIQFAPIYPLELEGRLTPTQFLESINAINELLISAHSLRYAFLDNVLAVFTLQLSRLFVTPHYEKEMQRLRLLFDELNAGLFNPVGLNLLWPRKVAFLFLEIEYYVSPFLSLMTYQQLIDFD